MALIFTRQVWYRSIQLMEVNKIQMRFVVSHLQIGRLGYEYDPAKPDKVTVVSDKTRHLYGQEDNSQIVRRCSAFIFKREDIHPNELMVDCLELDKSLPNPPKFGYLSQGIDPTRPVLIDVASENRHNQSGLGHFAKFRLDDLLESFTDATLRQQPTTLASKSRILEIIGGKQRIEVDLILEQQIK